MDREGLAEQGQKCNSLRALRWILESRIPTLTAPGWNNSFILFPSQASSHPWGGGNSHFRMPQSSNFCSFEVRTNS